MNPWRPSRTVGIVALRHQILPQEELDSREHDAAALVLRGGGNDVDGARVTPHVPTPHLCQNCQALLG
jgi:hypothetical protein